MAKEQIHSWAILRRLDAHLQALYYERQQRPLPMCPLVIALVPFKCPSRNVQFPHRVPFTKAKMTWSSFESIIYSIQMFGQDWAHLTAFSFAAIRSSWQHCSSRAGHRRRCGIDLLGVLGFSITKCTQACMRASTRLVI